MQTPDDMTDTPHTARRAAILRILRDSTVRNQEELVQALRQEGVEATQSSVSRDLRELGVAKAGDRYLLPATAVDEHNPFAAVAGFVTGIRTAGDSLTIVRTTVGGAQSVAVAIDQASWPELAGTISGDDTIFLATDGAVDQGRLRERLRTLFGI